jgi:cell wall-associated NlpC family hydrolase
MRATHRAVRILLFVGVGLTAAGCLGKTPTPSPAPPPATTVPAGGRAAAAVAYAVAQVGLPYCYAGTGPACFDCSGLTYTAWRSAGLTTIPRTSGAQYAAFPSVPLSQLQPGDLLFPADPTQHVAMYIGNGHMVHATKTGDFIKDVLVSSYPVVYAVRPS